MKLTVNGEIRVAREGEPLDAFLSGLGLAPEKVAVERNGQIVPRSAYAATPLSEGDKLEIVEFVGGGA